MESEEPIQSEPTHVLPPPPCKSNRIFHPSERYLGIIPEDVKKIFHTENRIHGDNPKIYYEAISDIDSEKWLETIKLEIDRCTPIKSGP